MKLQNLIIIFIIIMLPIILIFSLYLNLETKTIALQTDLDGKLIEATKEAVEAFEINTTEWNNQYSSLANAKRQNIMSSINVFTTSLSEKLRIGGTSKENILNYIPAIVYIMYDGYYIYTPTYVPKTITNDNGVQLFYYKNSGSEGAKITELATQNIEGEIVAGEPLYVAKSGQGTSGKYNGKNIYYTNNIVKAEKEYRHVLKTFVPYTINYNSNGKNYIINYTLDNYIRIIGENETKEGYIIEGYSSTNKIVIPVNTINGIKYNENTINPERLEENMYVKENYQGEAELKTYSYIYNSSNDKRYYDTNKKQFFTLNSNNTKTYLPNVDVGHTSAEYKKILIRTQNTSNWGYTELYQLINGNDTSWYYKDNNNQYVKYPNVQNFVPDKVLDCSAINYYVETACFNDWLYSKFSKNEINDILNKKRETIITNINNNLNLSISNYNANSRQDYDIFELTDADWDQALSNISMITFFQGKRIGLKTYNNYAIVTSTENNEFVSEDSLFYIGESPDGYYHRYCCTNGRPEPNRAYRTTEFKVQRYMEDENIKYYYKHNQTLTGGSKIIYPCFDCIVNRNNYIKTTNDWSKTLYSRTLDKALARERYIQMSRINLIID